MLRLEAEAAVPSVGDTAFAFNAAVQKIGGVQLHAGFGGRDLEHAPRHRLDDARGKRQRVALAIQNEVVIVAAAVRDLRVLCLDARANQRRFTEIEGLARYWRESARWNRGRIDRGVAIRIDHELMTKHVTAGAGEIEAGVL